MVNAVICLYNLVVRKCDAISRGLQLQLLERDRCIRRFQILAGFQLRIGFIVGFLGSVATLPYSMLVGW